MAFLSRIGQSKLRHLSQQSKTIPYAALLNSTVSHSKACVSDNPYLIPHSRPTDYGSKVRFFAAPVQANSKKIEKSATGPRMNEKITAEVVRLVMDEEHLIVSRHEALERARKLELDLVEVQGTANPPVCKIMDFHKEKYKKEMRDKENIKTKSEKTLRADSKEVKFSRKTEAKDLKMKADMVKRFLEKGYRVKCTATDAEDKDWGASDQKTKKDLEASEEKKKKDLGALFARLTVLIEDVALVECEPTLGRGKEAYIMVRHVKFGPSKKGGGKKLKTGEKTSPEVQDKGTDDANGVTSQVADIQINTVPQRRSSQSDNRLPITPIRSHTVPLPPRESSDGTQNRYRSSESRSSFPPTKGMDNRGPGMREPHIPYQRRGTPTDLHLSPSMRETRQAETSAPVFRNSTPPPSNFPKQEPPGPSAPRTPGLGYGMFSNQNCDPRHGAAERIPPNLTSPSSRPDTSQRPGTGSDKVGHGGIRDLR